MGPDRLEVPIWRLRARRSTARCVLQCETHWVDLLICQDNDRAVVRERFPNEDIARERARQLRDGLLQRGWRDLLQGAVQTARGHTPPAAA